MIVNFKKAFGLIFLILSLSFGLFAQEIKVIGTVTSNSDQLSVPGVNVLIKGSLIGTVTDIDGNYSISATSDAVIVFSSIGFITQEVYVGKQKQINITLEDDVKALDEVVVIGYGQVKKSDVTGSISSISSEELVERPVSSLDMALQGKAAGVQITSTSGMPGSTASIRIRGHGSLGTSNAPLWVIDGYVGGDFNTVAPEDIESIEILKDASSTAIYGARGGNGVIIVTTKRGKKNQNSLSFTHYTEFRSLIKKMDMLNAADFMTLRNQALANDGFKPQYNSNEINLTEPVRSTGYITDTEWQDVVFSSALAHYYNLSFTGGSDKTQFAISANHKNEDGIIDFSSYRKTGINLNLNHEISEKLTIGIGIKGYSNQREGFEVPTGSNWAFGPAGNALASLPIYPVSDSLGNYYTNKIWDNPLYAAEGDKDITKTNRIQGNLNVNYSPIPNLSINATIAGDAYTSMRTRFISSGLNEATQTQNLAKGLISQGNYSKWVGNVVATYDRTFIENHHVTILLGVEQEMVNSNSHQISGTDINKESLLWYDMNAFNPDYYKAYSNWWSAAFRSQFSRISYSLLDRYLIQATVRRDGSSKFGSSNQFGVFPSVSGAWKVHQEQWMSTISALSQLKFRASWGQSGNDQIALYQWLPEISYSTGHNLAVIGDNVVQGAVIGKIPNENIGWEVSTTSNIGIDISLWKNRFNFSADLYNRNTSDLLWDDLLPLYTGYGDGWDRAGVKITTNLAEMNNRGLELAIGGTIIQKGNLKWDANVNFSTNRNLVKYIGEQSEFFAGITKVEVEKPIGNIFGYRTDGLYSLQDSIDQVIPGGLRPGDQRYEDVSKDGKVNDEDRTIIGNALPDFTAGMSTNLSYQNWTFSATLNAMVGAEMYNGTYEMISQGDLGRTNGGEFLKDAWSIENQDTDVPRLSTTYQSKISDRFVEDASFLKLSNVMLSYSLPLKLRSKLNVKAMKVYVSGQNLFMLTNYTGFDPEQHSGGDSNLNLGYDNKNYPSYRGMTVGVNLSF